MSKRTEWEQAVSGGSAQDRVEPKDWGERAGVFVRLYAKLDEESVGKDRQLIYHMGQ
jgi:hypothetical protein